MKQFNINKNSTLPYLEIEPVNDGRNDFKKLYIAIQSADVFFTMTNMDNGIKKIANAKAHVVSYNDGGCEEKFKIQYRWKERDTKDSGRYLGQFKIRFNDNIKMENIIFPKGDLIVPIAEEIQIVINDSSIKN